LVGTFLFDRLISTHYFNSPKDESIMLLTKQEYYNTFIAPIANSIKILICSILEENRDISLNIGLQAALNEIRVINMSLNSSTDGITEARLKKLYMKIDDAYSTVALVHCQFSLKKLEEQIITLNQVIIMFKSALNATEFIKRIDSAENAPASPADLLLALSEQKQAPVPSMSAPEQNDGRIGNDMNRINGMKGGKNVCYFGRKEKKHGNDEDVTRRCGAGADLAKKDGWIKRKAHRTLNYDNPSRQCANDSGSSSSTTTDDDDPFWEKGNQVEIKYQTPIRAFRNKRLFSTNE
jgi:hypothetical protein